MSVTTTNSFRRDLLLAALIFITAFSLRLIYLNQISQGPLFSHPIADSAGFDIWAQRIIDGDWFSNAPTDPGMSVRSAPIYPVFLAVAKSIGGNDWFRIRAFQMLIGSLSCVLVFVSGRAFLGRNAGAIAGFLLAVYPPTIYYDGLIQKGVLGIFFLCALLALFGTAQRRPSVGHALGIGICFALLTLDRENAIVLFAVIVAWLWLRFSSHSARTRLTWLVAACLGIAAVYLPVALRNWRADGAFALSGSNFGANFYIGNGAQADGAYIPLRPGHASPAFERQDAIEIAEEAAGHSLAPSDVSAFWIDRTWQDIREDPAHWLGLLTQKWLLLWNRLEIADAEDFYLTCMGSPLLRALDTVFHFGVLAPLALAGLVLTWSRRRDLWILYATLLAIAASVAVFFILGRYRFPLVPVLVIFAAAACIEARLRWQRKERATLAWVAVLCVASAIVANWPLRSRERQSITARMNLGTALSEMNRLDEAALILEEVTVARPAIAAAHHNLGNVRTKLADYERAAAAYREALRHAPDLAESHLGLADALRELQQYDTAVRHYARAAELRPRSAVPRFKLGITYALMGSQNEAVDAFRETIDIDPTIAAAWYNLATALLELNQRDRAVEALRQGIDAHPTDRELRDLLNHLLPSDSPQD